MTDEEQLSASLCTYMIPKTYVDNDAQTEYLLNLPEFVPACYVNYYEDRDLVRMYAFGSFIDNNGVLRRGYCVAATIPAGELGQYQVGSNNKHKRLETYIQRRQR